VKRDSLLTATYFASALAIALYATAASWPSATGTTAQGVVIEDAAGHAITAFGGSGGTASNFAAGFPTSGTAIGVKNGANMVNLTADSSSNLNINCVVGCAGGTFNNNADAVATSATNGQSAAWLYGFNGTTWDRLRVNGSKALTVDGSAVTQPVSAASLPLPTGAATAAKQPALGTAGTPSADVISVQGVASGTPQPVSGTVATTPPANASTNITQFGGSAVATGTGAGGAGIPRVTLSNDSSLAANQSVNIAQLAGSALQAEPCQTVAKNYTPISLTTNTQIITGTSAKQTYICAINLTAPNTNVALVEGTGSVCATGIAGMAGGTTAATGWKFADATAPGVGLSQGNGASAIMRTATAADNVCLLVSAANQVSGHIVWVQL
jgi:hypothetical protein